MQFNSRALRNASIFDEIPGRCAFLAEPAPRPESLIPHRDPFIYIGELTYLDKEAMCLSGAFDVSADADVFRGHFPGDPVFPGVLQVESMCQALCCLFMLLGLNDGAENLRLTRILESTFVRGIAPGSRMIVRCAVEEADGLAATGLAQISVAGKVCSFGRFEVAWG